MKKHIASVHEGKKPYKCEICHVSFTQKGSLKKHIFLKMTKINRFKFQYFSRLTCFSFRFFLFSICSLTSWYLFLFFQFSSKSFDLRTIFLPLVSTLHATLIKSKLAGRQYGNQVSFLRSLKLLLDTEPLSFGHYKLIIERCS